MHKPILFHGGAKGRDDTLLNGSIGGSYIFTSSNYNPASPISLSEDVLYTIFTQAVDSTAAPV